MANYGFVYLMSNNSMPDIYKIGYTDRSPLQRRDELSSSTSIPTSFELIFYIECENPIYVEKEMHDAFSKYRVSNKREFFKFDIKTLMINVYTYFEECGINFTKCSDFTDFDYKLHLILEKEDSEKIKLLGKI